MDIKNIESFLRVAELGSFTKAAEELNYAQSTVTAQIQQLERELGYPLFDRIGKVVTLTPLGQKFRSNADEILLIWHQSSTIGQSDENMNGLLRIGVLESLLMSTLPDILEVFRSRYKNVEVQVRMGPGIEVLAMLKQNSLDLVYTAGNLVADSGLTRRYTSRERLVFFAPRQHPLVGKSHISLTDILKYNIITTERSSTCHIRLAEFASSQHIAFNHCILMDSTAGVAELVQRGIGISFLPEYSITRQLKNGQLIILDVDVPDQICFSQILCHKGKWIPPFVNGFIDIVRELRPEVIK